MLKKFFSSYVKNQFILWIAVIFIFSTGVSLLSEQPVKNGLFFALFEVGAIILPGYVFVRIMRLKYSTTIECFGYSYLMGYCASIFLYFLIVPFGMQKYSIVYLIVLDCVCFIYLIYKYTHSENNHTDDILCADDQFGTVICIIYIAAYLIVALFLYGLKNALPPMVESNVLHHDSLYWIGNTVELTKEYPIRKFFDYPQKYTYHYFSSLQLALATLITGIRPIVVGFTYEYIQAAFLIVFGAYMLFSKYAKNRWIVPCGLQMLLFVSGFEYAVIVSYREHMFDGPFGFDYGIGFFLFYLLMLFRFYFEEEFSMRDSVCLWIVFTCLVGIKAPTGSVALVISGLVCITKLFTKKQIKKTFVVGIPILMLFLLMYIFVVDVKGYSGGDFDRVLKAAKMVEKCKLAYWFRGLPKQFMIRDVSFTVGYIFLSNPIVYSGIVYVVLRKFIKKERINQLAVVVLLTMLVAELITVFIGMVGSSEMYFIMSAFPLGIFYIILNSQERKVTNVERGFLVVGILIGMTLWVVGYSSLSDLNYVAMHKKNIYNGNWNTDEKENRSYIDAFQWDAYEYLRSSAEKDTMVLANHRGYRTIGTVSECYIHSCDDFMLLTNKKDQNDYLEKKMSEYDYTYLIYNRYYDPEFEFLSDYGRAVFENESTVIYKLKGK